MKDKDVEQLRSMLKRSYSPLAVEPQRDLWPRMLERMGESSLRRVPWLDWALLGLLVVLLIVVPEIIPILLYQL